MGGQPQSATVHKTSISPMLSVRNGAKAIEFYKAAFGAAELFWQRVNGAWLAGRRDGETPLLAKNASNGAPRHQWVGEVGRPAVLEAGHLRIHPTYTTH